MQVYSSIDIKLDTPCVLALGCFDGVHLGHQAVINTAKQTAESCGLPLAVFTFETPPRNFFFPDSIKMITSTEQKLKILDSLGVDICVCLPCSSDIFNISPEDFIEDIIFTRLHARHVVCGYNYSFGKGGHGGPALIGSLCRKYKATLSVVEEQILDGYSVSSSLLRSLIAEGDVRKACRLMGRHHFLTATVVDGQHLARTLGFPTVNIIPQHGLLLPKSGVYVTKTSFDGTHRFGITNVGIRPTVNVGIMCAETHLFDFNGDLYGKDIKVEFLHFLRAEQKFESIETMAGQIRKDIETAKSHISTINTDK